MTPEELGRLLDELGQRIGPAGEYVFQLAVRQAIAEGVIGLITGLVLIAGTIAISTKATRWVLRQEMGHYSDAFDRAFPIAILSVPTAFLLAMGWLLAADSITALINPEYAAIRDILSRIVPQ